MLCRKPAERISVAEILDHEFMAKNVSQRRLRELKEKGEEDDRVYLEEGVLTEIEKRHKVDRKRIIQSFSLW